MRETTHLLRQYAVTTEVSTEHFASMRTFLEDELEKRLRNETHRIGMTITDINHRHSDELIFLEDGTPHNITRLACIATGYLPDESAEQTLHKMRIAEGEQEWIDEDD